MQNQYYLFIIRNSVVKNKAFNDVEVSGCEQNWIHIVHIPRGGGGSGKIKSTLLEKSRFGNFQPIRAFKY